MADIEYFGITPEDTEFLNSEKLHAILKAHPELLLVTVDTYEGKDLYYKAELPLPEDHNEDIAVIDVDNRGSFMWILNDSYCYVEDPSSAFIEILKLMDTHSTETIEARLFMSPDGGFREDEPEILAAEFDFRTGEYVL